MVRYFGLVFLVIYIFFHIFVLLFCSTIFVLCLKNKIYNIIIMSCNSVIHDESRNMEESICPFCDEQLAKIDNSVKVVDLCCNQPDIVNNNFIVCKNCGSVHGVRYVNEYIDFYENMYKIRRKSIYNRKYHIENMIKKICYNNKIQLNSDKIDKICKVFIEIDNVLNKVHDKRKRMININFIIRQLFIILNIPYNDIKITKCKKTKEYYTDYWNKIVSLIGCKKIKSIVQ